MVRKAVIGLGGNLGDVERQLRLALEALDGLCGTKLLRVSPFYRTAAVEVTGPQPDYLNCVAEIETSLSPHALLGSCPHTSQLKCSPQGPFATCIPIR